MKKCFTNQEDFLALCPSLEEEDRHLDDVRLGQQLDGVGVVPVTVLNV